MSKATNPETESSVTCGFFNALHHDRTYDATQMSSIFDGIINDGVFATIGTCFMVKAYEDNMVTVGIGKAWFNHTWTYNDAILPVNMGQAEVILNRIDAIVLEVNSSELVRDNFIKVVYGTPSSNPVNPVLENSTNVHQYPICYIYRPAGSESIDQSNIRNMVGTEATPFITGILKVISLDELFGQWEAQLNNFVSLEKENFLKWFGEFIDELNQKAAELDTWTEDEKADLINWTEAEKKSVIAWFNEMKGQLSDDAAINLKFQIDRETVDRILLDGFTDGTKVFSDDGTIITTTASDGKTLEKTFTNGFRTITSVLKSPSGGEIARMIKTFSSDGKTISSETIYLM